MRYQTTNRLALLLAALSLPLAAHALSSDSKQPIFIEAEKVILDKEQGISRYHGNVRFKQGSLVIRGGSVKLYHKGGQLEKAIIQGEPASFQQTPDKGDLSIVSRAYRMEYLADQSRLLLYKSAKVTQGNNVFSGERIEYDIIKGRVVANGGESRGNRINAILEETKSGK